MPPRLGGLTYKSVDIQDDEIFFDLMPGGLFLPASHRGEDDVVPGKAGRYRRNRVPDVRLMDLRGYVKGVGADLEERQQSWRSSMAVLTALLDPDTGGSLVVIGPYMGLADDETATITAYPKSWVEGQPQNLLTYQKWAFVLEAVDVDWEYES